MTIEIEAPAYEIFYEVLKETFIAKEFEDGKSPYGRGDDSPQIWHHSEKGKRPRADEVFKYTVSGDYFYKMRSAFSGHKTKGKINAKALIYALEYIGIALPEDLMCVTRIPPTTKAKALFKEFKKRYYNMPDFILEEQEILKANPVSQHPQDLAKKCVETFYKSLALGRHEKAWSELSPKFQNREGWLGDFDRFKGGYITTRAIRQICVFNINQIDPHIIECKVYYEDEVATHPIDGLHLLGLLTITELDDFVRIVKKIQQQIELKGGKNFDRVPIRKLFEPTGMEYIWHVCGFKGTDLAHLFPNPHVEIVDRIYHCTCILNNGKWLLNDLRAVKIYSVR